jgi:glycosyltransferase involved in cell wall biosynthesis
MIAAAVSNKIMSPEAIPKVSVIIPNYNHARYLRQRIDSVLSQTLQDFEAILLDDCSTDESRSVLSEYAKDPRVRIEFNEKNSGSTFKQWNKGVRLARGEYIWIAESDDYADTHLLEKLVSRLDAEPSAVLSYCRSWRVSADGELSGYLDTYLPALGSQKWTGDFRADGNEECRKYLVFCNTVLSASSVLFRRKVYLQVGGADETLALCGDWKTWASMALTGGTITYVGEPLNYYRFHDASVTEKSLRNGIWALEALHVVDWILQKVTLDETGRRKLGELLSHLWVPAVLNGRIPNSVRWRILRHAMSIDRRALRKLLRTALTFVRMTLARRWRSLRGASLL